MAEQEGESTPVLNQDISQPVLDEADDRSGSRAGIPGSVVDAIVEALRKSIFTAPKSCLRVVFS